MRNVHYVNVDDKEIQYDPSEFSEGHPVKARYIHALNDIDKGNCFIEALPLPRQGLSEINNAYLKEIPFNAPVPGKTSIAEELSEISALRQIRFPLPFHEELENACYMALINSYRSRHVYEDEEVNIETVQKNRKEETHQLVVGDSGAATNAGFALLGYSGCGKSSALKILFSNYPQVIQHEGPDKSRFTQIVYLVVNCMPNSNFKALYESIGRAIDRALGNVNPVYEYEIRKAAGLAGKLSLVCRYIEQFAIGIIVFDEIQLIDFTHNKENSFEGLMTMANMTKVAVAVVGTEDAYDQMFTKMRTARRVGAVIQGNSYCSNIKFFTFLVKHLFRYRWTAKEYKITPEIIKALYQYSGGIIDQLIGIYMHMGLEYLGMDDEERKYFVLDEKYIRHIVEKYYPGMQRLIADLNNPLSEVKRVKLVRDAEAEMNRMIDERKQQTAADEMIAEEDKEELKRVVVDNIMMFTDDYNKLSILRETDSVLKTKSGQAMDAKALTRKVLAKLKSGKTDKRPPAKKAPKEMDAAHISMKNFLEEDN